MGKLGPSGKVGSFSISESMGLVDGAGEMEVGFMQ